MKKMLILGLALLVTAPAKAALLDFNLSWSGSGFSNNATATGLITIDDTVLANPGSNSGPAAIIGIAAFEITISGASTGNGTFALAEFINFNFDTNGGALDLTQELVGQATSGGPWGTCFVTCGNFDFAPFAPGRPVGTFYFEITTNAGGPGDQLLLTAFTPVTLSQPTAVSKPGTLAVFGLGLAGLGYMRRRRSA